MRLWKKKRYRIWSVGFDASRDRGGHVNTLNKKIEPSGLEFVCDKGHLHSKPVTGECGFEPYVVDRAKLARLDRQLREAALNEPS